MQINFRKERIRIILRLVIAAGLSFVILNVIFLLYFTLPSQVPAESGATDYKWESNTLFVKATEGFAFGFTDENGYVNSYPGAGSEIGTILIGSSHMEATNIMPEKTAAYVLNKLLDDSGFDNTVYNIGMSSHNFIRCARNFENAIEQYKPTEYVVIETASVQFNKKLIDQVLDGTYPVLVADENVIMKILQKFSYLRTVNYQINHGLLGIEKTEKKQHYENIDMIEYRESLSALLGNIALSAETNNCDVIIIYHPHMSLDDKGNCIDETDKKYLSVFAELCEENGITFHNMSANFIAYYNEEYKLPHGFINTETGSGHLNNAGHRLLAEQLFSIMAEGKAN